MTRRVPCTHQCFYLVDALMNPTHTKRIRADYKPELAVTEQLARERFILAENIFQQIVEVIQK